MRDLPNEVWRVVDDTKVFGTYLISNYGRLKRLAFYGGRYHYPEMIMKAHRNRKGGYYKVRVGKELYYIHRIVALAFLPRKERCNYVDHRNGDISDNRAKNLQWVTAKQNSRNPITKWERDKRFGMNQGDRPKPKETAVPIKTYNPTIRLSFGEYPGCNHIEAAKKTVKLIMLELSLEK